MNQRKSLKELNLLDKFLFDEAMDDQENVKTMLDIIFLNTRGKHPELVSSELIELLKYMERSTDEVSGECKSKRIQEMHRRVCQIKASEKTVYNQEKWTTKNSWYFTSQKIKYTSNSTKHFIPKLSFPIAITRY